MIVVSQLMENEESISQNTIIVDRIGGVQEIQHYAVCNSCRRKLGNLQSDLSVCDSKFKAKFITVILVLFVFILFKVFFALNVWEVKKKSGANLAP